MYISTEMSYYRYSYTIDIILLNFIFTGLHGYKITLSLSTNKQKHRLSLLKTGDTCCTNPSLNNDQFWQFIKEFKKNPY